MMERSIELTCKRHARRANWWTRKFSSPANKAEPDDIFLKNGRVKFIEFKAPGERPTDLQWQKILDIRDHGGEAYWCDSVVDFLLLMTETVDEIGHEARDRLSTCPNEVLFRIGRPCR